MAGTNPGPVTSVLESETPIPAFARWTKRYLAADANGRKQLLAEGRSLAEARRPVLKKLIIEDPRRALQESVTALTRQQMPLEIVALLERPVAARGVMRVYKAGPESVANGEKPRVRYVETVRGETFQAYVFGRRAQSTEWVPNLSAIGVEIDGQLALDERPLRVMEAGEVPPAELPRVNVCPISKIETPLPASTEPITPATPALIANGEVVYLCDGSHTTLFEELLIQGESSSGGAQSFTGILPAVATPSVGVVKVLFIPAIFPDQNETPITEAGAHDMMKQTADFYQTNSYGRLTLVATVTPPVRLPKTRAWYVGKDTTSGFIREVDGLSLEMSHAKDEARKLGYDWQDYHATIVRANGGARSPTSFGGGGNVWMRVDSVSTATHEIGHAFGLDHANYWETNGASIIGPGGNVEYGDNYDNMGTGSPPNAHYNTQAKNQIKWLPDEFAPLITTSGTYRLYQLDQPTLDPGKRYGLRVRKDNDRTYWGEYRLLGGNNWTNNGMLLGWKWPSLPGGDGNNFMLLDTTPGSVNGKSDAGITIGRTFSDMENGIHITTLAVNSNTTPPSLDMVVNLGNFPGNNAPTLALSPTTTTVPTNTNVTFTATANDVDGDALSYAWQWHDNTISGSGPTATRSFASSGVYTLSCVVSDMKGGVAVRNSVITVGSGNNRFTISGRVTRAGIGLPNITVGTGGANGTFTDSDGYYTISNLAAGNYSVIAEEHGLSFNSQFNNSITVGPSFTGADFTVEDLPSVSITAPTAVAAEGGAAGVFRITRTGPVAAPKDVFVFSAQGTAAKGTTTTNDYYFTPDYVTGSPFQTFTIPAGSAFLDVTVTARNEGTSEGEETVTLVLGADNSYVNGTPGSAAITIQDANSALPRVSLTVSEPQIAENSGSSLTATVTRTGATTAALAVPYTVASTSTATSVADFIALSGTVTIPIGAASESFTITPVNDSESEPTETVTLQIATGASFIANAAASTFTARITDDDTQIVTVSASDASAQEIDRSLGGAVPDPGVFLLTRSGPTSAPVTIYYSVAGTALHGTDYDALPGSVVIPAGQTRAAVTIMPRVDDFAEGTESVLLALGAGFGSYQIGGSATATVSIMDNAADKPLLDVTAYSAIAAEPSTNGTFRITAKGLVAPVTVNYTLSGTAINGTDYDSTGIWSASTSGTTSILRGVWSSNATNTWSVGDGGTILKWNGTSWSAQSSGTTTTLHAVWGTSATNVWAVGDGGTILRWNGTAWSSQSSGTTNALRGVWGFDAGNVWAVGDGGTILKWNGTSWAAQTSGVTTTLNSAWGDSATSVWAAGAGGVIRKWNGTSWGSQTSGTTNELRSIWGTSGTSLWIAGDAGTILRSTNGTSWSSQASNSVAVVNSIWGADVNNLWAACANGTILRTTNSGSAWSVQVSNVSTALNSVRGSDINNLWAVGDGGVAVNLDSATSLPLSGTLLIPVEGRTLDLGIRPINDALLEEMETIVLTLTPDPAYSLWSPLASATMFLRDDDQPTVFVDGQIGTGGADSIAEGSTTTTCKFFVSRTGSTTAALTVNYTIAGTATAGTDYTSTNLTGNVTIPAGQSGVDITFNTITDTAAEGMETILFQLAPGTGGTNYARGPDAKLHILDDDANTQSVAFASPGSAGSESVTSVNIPVTLNAPATSPVSVEYNLEAGARTASYLYGTWLRIVRTGTSYVTSASTDGVNWTTQSSTRTITMSSASYQAGFFLTNGTTNSTAGAVIDNVSITGLSAGGTAGALTAAEIGANAPTGGYQQNGGTHQITAGGGTDVSTGTGDGCRFVYFPITSSANCTVTARVLSMSSNAFPKGGVMIRESGAAGAVRMALHVNSGTIQQTYRTALNGAGTNASGTTPTLSKPRWLRIQRAGNIFTASASPDNVTWSPLGGGVPLGFSTQLLIGLAVSSRSDGALTQAAFDNVSITPAPSGTLQDRTVGFVNEAGWSTFNAGAYTVTASGAGILNTFSSTEDEGHFLSVPVTSDFTLTARLNSISSANAQAGLMVRESTNYRARAAWFGLIGPTNTASMAEWRARQSATESGEGSGIDYSLAPGVLNFAIGEQTKNITLNVTNDAVIEPLEFVNVLLKNPTNALIGGGTSSFTYTIVDDDVISALPAAGFASAASSGPENVTPVEIPVVLSEPPVAAVSMTYSVTAGSATDGSDFTSTTGTLNFAAGQTFATLPVALLDDSDVEGAETVTITLSAPLGAVLGTLAAHTFTINDDDTPVVTIVATDDTASEAGLETGTFTFYRTGSTASSLAITYGVTGTASSATDLQGVSTGVTFAAGSSTATRLVIPLDDALPEVPETTTLTLTPGAGYTVGSPSAATVTILDDDVNTVTLTATDALATEAAGNGGQLTLTRTGPLTASLPVTLAVTGNATSGSDFTAITTSQTFAISQSSIVINVSTLTDATIEGDEFITVSVSSSSTYIIGSPSIATITIKDDDLPPSVFISSPGSKSTIIDTTNGLMFSAVGSDDGLPSSLTYTWSKLFGPGNVVFGSANAANTTATFSVAGVYGVRVTASDGAFTATDDVIVQSGGFNFAKWITQDQGPPATRGIGGESDGVFTLIGSGTGYTGTNDSGHLAFRQLLTAAGDATIIVRLTGLSGPATRLGGITMRDTSWKGSRRVTLALNGSNALVMNNRTTANNSGTATTPATGLALPLWLKLDRVGGTVTASHAPDAGGAPGAWVSDGTSTATMGNDLIVGMIVSAGASTTATATAAFDNVSVTPAIVGAALHSEDIGNYVTTGSSSESAGTTTITGYGSYDGSGGHFRYQQVWGDCVITARLVTHTGAVRGAQSGVSLRESTDNGAFAFYGTTTTDGYQAHWRSVPSGSQGTLQNGGSGWLRLVRRGNSVNSYKAPNVGGNPGTWTLNSGNLPVVLTGPLLVGLVVDSNASTTIATGTFSGFTVTPLNTAPVVDAGTLAATVPPFNLNATVTDDGQPAPPAAYSVQWSQLTGPGPVVFGNTALEDTLLTLSADGAHTLRLTANDGDAITFDDLTFTGYTSAYAAWQAAQFVGGSSNPTAAMLLDPDFDGIVNLLEYAVGTDPETSAPSNIILDTTTVSSQNYLRLTVTKNPAATDVTYEVQATDDLTDTNSWSSAGLVIEANTSTELRVRDNVAMTGGARRFMRVLVTKL